MTTTTADPCSTQEVGQPRWRFTPRLRRLMTSTGLWLVLISGGQVVLAMRPGQIATPFEDEALYVFMGHRMIEHLLHGSFLHEHPGAFFSGAPGLYPVLAAVGDRLGGLQGARVVSLIFAILSTIGVYGLGRQLFGKLAGLLGALTFTLSGSVIYQSGLATFDSTTLALIAMAAWLAVYSTKTNGLLWAPVVSALLTLAFLAKYAGAAYAPVVAALAVAVGWRQLRWTIVRRATFVLTGVIVMAYFVIALWGQSLIPGIQTTTTSRTVIDHGTTSQLTEQIVDWVGPWLGLALIGGLFRFRQQPALILVLLVGAIVGPAQHIRIGEATSLAKHLAFGMLFAAPLVGDLLAGAVRRMPTISIPVATGLLTALCLLGLHYSSLFRTSWVPDDNLLSPLASAISLSPKKPILGERPSPERYAFRNVVDATQWNDTYAFSYGGKTGRRAYKEAVDQSYFGTIYLDRTTPAGRYVMKYLNTRKTAYRLSAKVPRYMRRSYVGNWVIYTLRRRCAWRSRGDCGPPVIARAHPVKSNSG
jgi:Dolichyl-phosphate-mannose-protein mannosyltransferase